MREGEEGAFGKLGFSVRERNGVTRSKVWLLYLRDGEARGARSGPDTALSQLQSPQPHLQPGTVWGEGGGGS